MRKLSSLAEISLSFLSLYTFWGKCVYFFEFLNNEIHSYILFDIIVHFIIQKLKNKHTFLIKYTNWESLGISHFDRTRGEKNQIFPTYDCLKKKKFPDIFLKCLSQWRQIPYEVILTTRILFGSVNSKKKCPLNIFSISGGITLWILQLYASLLLL